MNGREGWKLKADTPSGFWPFGFRGVEGEAGGSTKRVLREKVAPGPAGGGG